MKNSIFVERSWCKGCGLCVSFCAKGVLEVDGEGKAAAGASRVVRGLRDMREAVPGSGD